MKYTRSITFVLAAGAGFAAAQLGIDDSDVPLICRQICQPLISLSSLCSSESATDTSCICENTSFDVLNLGSMCAICAEQANALNDDLRSVSAACSFTQGPYNQLSASSVAATVIVTATHGSSVLTTSPTTPEATSQTFVSEATSATSATSASGNGAPAPTGRAAGFIVGAGAMAAGLLL